MSGGIDGRQLRALLATYLRTSLRGKAAAAFFRRRPGKWRGTIALVLLYAVIGLTAAYGGSGSRSPFSYALVLHTITFVMLGMSLTAEAGDVLFHAAEHDLLGHLPVSNRTLLLAKSLSLLAFALMLAMAINLPAVLFAFRLPWVRASFPPLHLGAAALLATFATSTVVFAYGLAVRFVDRERFDNVAVWSQAGLSVTFVGLSQSFARVVELPIVDLEAPFCLVFPPAWFAALDVVASASSPSRAVVLSLLALGTTATLGWITFTRLAHGYGTAVVRLSEAAAVRSPSVSDETSPGVLARWWLRDPVERAAFRLAAAYMRRDREIKARLYPSLGFFLLVPAAQLFSRLPKRFTTAALLAIVLLGMLPSIVLEALRVSSHHSAAEVFAVAPLQSAGPLFQGVRKAAMVYVLLPAMAIAVLWIAVMDPHVFPLAIPSLIAMPLISMLPAAFRAYVPLSVPPTTGRQSLANIVLGILATVIGGSILLVSWLAWRLGFLHLLTVGEVFVVAIGTRALARRVGNRPLRGVH